MDIRRSTDCFKSITNLWEPNQNLINFDGKPRIADPSGKRNRIIKV